MKSQRLDKFLSSQTVYTRTDISKLLWKRKVSVNGKTAREGELKINPAADRIEVSGREIKYRENMYIVLTSRPAMSAPQRIKTIRRDRAYTRGAEEKGSFSGRTS